MATRRGLSQEEHLLRAFRALSPKGRALFVDLLNCAQESFTGSYQVDFVNGIPRRRHKGDTLDFGKDEIRPLTRGDS